MKAVTTKRGGLVAVDFQLQAARFKSLPGEATHNGAGIDVYNLVNIKNIRL